MFRLLNLFLLPLRYELASNAGTTVLIKLFRTSSISRRVIDVPSPEEVASLKKKYCTPKKIVHDLLMPIVFSGQIPAPSINAIPKLNGHYWKASLRVLWPHPMTFTGTHHCNHQAQENAYLLACQLYESVGLIYSDEKGTHAVSQDYVLRLLEKLISTSITWGESPAVLLVTSTCLRGAAGAVEWRSEVSVPLRLDCTVSATAGSLQAAHYMAYLRVCMKFKVLHCLNNKNALVSDHHLKSFLRRSAEPALPTMEEFDPDYQIYVDASTVGFGAYLLTKTDDKIRWISESWPQHFGQESITVIAAKFDSCFFEFYALIAACYTWKHKFGNKRVLCWSDNQHAVKLVNDTRESVTYTETKFGKLGGILLDMCQTYDIQIQALHVNRVHNIAADLLSRIEVDKFKKIIPTAEEKSKKVKKLLFRNPLVPKEFDPRNGQLS